MMSFFRPPALLIVAAILCGGCATTDPVTTAQIAAADFGDYPENHETLIKEHLYRTLIDPTSMLIEITEGPYQGYCRANNNFGYGVAFRLNAKNRLGGYVGWKGQVAFIRNGAVVNVFETFEALGEGNGPEMWVKPLYRLVPKDGPKQSSPL